MNRKVRQKVRIQIATRLPQSLLVPGTKSTTGLALCSAEGFITDGNTIIPIVSAVQYVHFETRKSYHKEKLHL